MLSRGACGRDGWSGSGTPPGGAAWGVGVGRGRTDRRAATEAGCVARPALRGRTPGRAPASIGDAELRPVDLTSMDRVVEIDHASRAARIQAGALGPAVEDQLRPHGLTLRHLPQSFEDRPDTIELVRAALREVRRLTESEQPNAEELSDGELSALSLDRPPIAISKPGDSGQTLVRVWRARCCSRCRGRRCRPIDRPGASRATSRSCSAPVSSRLTRPTKDTALSV